jgi:hypothetical protein
MKALNIFSWILRITAAGILLQTLYFKFSAHPESVELFTKLGVEPWGRIGTGLVELIAGILLLLPSTIFLGASIGVGLMMGAIISHLTVIGIASKGDGGQLFMLAIIVLIACTILTYLYKHQGIKLLQKLKGSTGNGVRALVLILGFSSIISSCKKEDLASTQQLNETLDNNAMKVHSGNFMNGPDRKVSGIANIYKTNNNYELQLINFKTDNGPALHVFVSKQEKLTEAIDLGSLKSTNGNQVYKISGMPDFNEYKYISIHCVDYNHFFGAAKIN